MKVYKRLSLEIYMLDNNDIVTASGDDESVKFDSGWLNQFGGFKE